ncbi:metallophosphoesterase family protein [Paenibacillus validus]|uniref:Metallophosphoesterase n=1 Tax=Paenibacillus validus TaxID=44253 RepID=A0A7X3CSL3_9BACL|nr:MULTISPECIES: metallophosphoesterase family protein [Paenibacillus]MED4603210.1 metallophosphoesterase family protein [Paenibacillus validus]MED4609385.1 metallophosphoesterase family protein [Paenibacillus validus]MUG71452.1 metallophosphoesterase [Paenibacillus validus]
MDKIAIISDIHSNLTALDTVLADIRGRGIERIVCLGDLVGKGPQPAESVDRIREVCETTVQGNWDHGIGGPQDKEAGRWQQSRLSAEQLRYLSKLPFACDLRISGRRVRLVHASASSVYHRVYRKASKREKLRMFENTEATGGFAGTDETPDVLGYGDLHLPFMHTLLSGAKQGLLLFNTGSVGAPYDGLPLASYTILEGVFGGDREAPFGIQWVRVPYDVERAIAIAEEVALPQLERFRYEQRSGREQ